MNLPYLRRNKPGFTLIELLVVVAIIAILLSIGFASFTTVQKRARDGQRKSDLKQIAGSLEQFYSDNNFYPFGQPSDGRISLNQDPSTCSILAPFRDFAWGTSFECAGRMYGFLPIAPSPGLPYAYYSCGDTGSSGLSPQSFILYANLENESDQDTLPSKGDCLDDINYNYWIRPER